MVDDKTPEDRIEDVLDAMGDITIPTKGHPRNQFRFFFKPVVGADFEKLKARIHALTHVSPEALHSAKGKEHGEIIRMDGVYTKEETLTLCRLMSGKMGTALPTGSIYIERINPNNGQFNLLGDAKDFRGAYVVL